MGKSYGDGAIKVESRSLEQLAIPESLLVKYAVETHLAEVQLSLLEPKQIYRVVQSLV